MARQWTLRAHDADAIQAIERTCNVSPVLAQILALRGICLPAEVRQFLDLKMTGLRCPDLLPGMGSAVELICRAISEKKKIIVYGDYDADGMTATAILFDCLRLHGAEVGFFVPNRLDEGYGVSNGSLKQLADRGAHLIVTVDCGITCQEQAIYARQLGLQLVITDHHHPGRQLPNSDAIVHPALPGHPYPFPGLSGAGVAFKLAWAICQRRHGSSKLPERMRNFLFSAVGLAAIGTVADVVPLLDENRIIVHHGLNCLRRFAKPGLSQLMKLAGLDQKPALASEDIAFSLAPRLNAAGRLGQAQLGVELLTVESSSRTATLAEYIDQLNRSRDSLDRAVYRSATKMIQQKYDPDSEAALVLAASDWHVGVIGIVAGRIAEKYNRPTVLISIDQLGNKPAVGSARSACGVNLYDALAGCRQQLIKFGGHPAAAGLTLEAGKIDEFREHFSEQVSRQVRADSMVPHLEIDAEAPLSHLTVNTLNEIERLAPFGQDNPRPVLCATGVNLAAQPITLGSEGRHISLQLEQHNVRLRAVGFGKSDWIEPLSSPGTAFDFAFKPVINEFRGRRNVELHLIDFRPAASNS